MSASGLPDIYRRLLTLDGAGMNADEIANVLGVDTVRVHYIRHQLRAKGFAVTAWPRKRRAIDACQAPRNPRKKLNHGLRNVRCRCGLRLPCNNCVTVADYAERMLTTHYSDRKADERYVDSQARRVSR